MQNVINRPPRKTKVGSKFKGVFRSRVKYGQDTWRAKCNIDLGTYATEIGAALAYNGYAKEHYGEFAKLNDVGIITNEEIKIMTSRLTSKKVGTCRNGHIRTPDNTFIDKRHNRNVCLDCQKLKLAAPSPANSKE